MAEDESPFFEPGHESTAFIALLITGYLIYSGVHEDLPRLTTYLILPGFLWAFGYFIIRLNKGWRPFSTVSQKRDA